MNRLKKIVNVIVDTIKLILIFAVCIIIALVGSYLLAVLVGLVPQDSEYYRPLSIDTVMNDLPFIGTNMIFIIAFLLVLGAIYLVALGYDRYSGDRNRTLEKAPEKPLQPPGAKQQ
jgi:tetrahydromethanopterin S-methyltransferase subunit E